MKKLLFRLICIAAVFAAAIIALAWLGHFWVMRVTPVSVVNLTFGTVHDVKIDLEGKDLDFGTLRSHEDRKVYGIPSGNEWIGISMVIQGRTVRRDLTNISGSEGDHLVVLIHSADDIDVITLTDGILK